MSLKTDKLIEEAQKLTLKGQLDKAIKAYQQVMSLEPSAFNHRQKLAELLVRAGRADDARAEFETIGKKYTSDGFYLKAIAVYKKLQGLFPGDIPITLTLASLNEKHGLVANALAEYKQVYDFYEKASDMEEALKILEKMQVVDPQNINIKLKLAEAYFQIGQRDESYAAFSKLASRLQERGDAAAFAKLDARIQQLFPQKAAFALEVLSEQVGSGNAASAIVGLQALLRTNSNDKRIWELIVEAFTQLKQPQKVKVAYQHYLKCFPNELSAQAGLIGCFAREKDLKSAIAHLDTYESGLLSSHFSEDLERIYRTLEELDPINLRVLEGRSRVCLELGKSEDVAALQSKIKSLQDLSGKPAHIPAQVENDPFAEPDYFGGQANDEPDFGEVSFADLDTDSTALHDLTNSEPPAVSSVFDTQDDEYDIEVEIDSDDDEDFDIPLGTTDTSGEGWLDSIGEIIDTIAVKPRGVKFASGHDDGSDAQSHYDLGVAFREMGLYDEAINEFRQAASDTGRQLECFILQCACLRDKGDLPNAEKILKLLINPSLNLEDASYVKYELALTYEACEKKDQLVELLSEIDTSNSGYRDVRARLDAARTDKNSLEFSDDDLLEFDLK